jgi:hypothetical protein
VAIQSIFKAFPKRTHEVVDNIVEIWQSASIRGLCSIPDAFAWRPCHGGDIQ